MKKQLMLLSFGSAAAVVLAAGFAHSADLQPLIVGSLAGNLHVQQDVPCGDDVNVDTPVIAGRFELSPSEGINVAGGGKRFTLTRGSITFRGFSVTRSCATIEQTLTYSDIYVQIAQLVTFTAMPTATPGVYSIRIPKSDLYIYFAATVNGALDAATKQPIEDVTGTLDLAAGRMSLHVVLGNRVTFRVGCVDNVGCLIDETDIGRLTADIAGALVYPDTDGDGVPNRTDNCKYVANPTQAPVATPTIAPPPNVTLNSCLSRNFGFAFARDICDGTRVTVTNDAPRQFDLGANTVRWRAEDGMSRVATANQTVTIVDTTQPNFTLVPPDIFMNNCGPATLGQPAGTDDCPGAVTFSNNAPRYFYVGVTPVAWTARDVSGNARNAIQNVTVVDTVAPTVTCVPTNPSGSSFVVSASDACTSAPVLKLGTYTLAIGETIQINETGQPGVRLIGTVGPQHLRHFQVGRGEAVITATDASNNSASVACLVPVR